MRGNKLSEHGYSLLEMMVVLVVLGIAASVMLVGGKVVGWTQRQIALAHVSREAQQNLYSVARDIRNANKIIEVSSTTLSMSMFNTRLGYDTAGTPPSGIFDPVNMGIVTYQYVETSTINYLSRMENFNNNPKYKQLMKNLLLTADNVNYIFSPFPSGTKPPYDAARVVFRCGRGFFAQAPRIYEVEAMVRSRD